jgi:Asp-tRNA(Asn)/Glu-tRNA(Gln) amidotransferase A subunit family amidase
VVSPSPDGFPSTVVEIATAVREGRVSAREVLEQYAARIAEFGGELNAIVIDDLARARLAAEAGPRGPLAGVPFTVKEAIAVEGLPGREASWLRPLDVAATDATVVRRLRAAGAVLLGKTNISELCAHPDSSNLVYGATRNPHDAARSAGGSSGGEAAAVAAGMSAVGIGSDYGGSIRAPAHFCGVVGMRPGVGRVPVDGHLPHKQPFFRRRWSTIGPLAPTVGDVEVVLSVLAGERIGVAGLPARVGVFRDALERPVAADCAAAVERAAAALDCEVREETPPFQLAAEELYDAVSAAETREIVEGLGPLDDASPQLVRIAERVSGAPPLRADALERADTLERTAASWFERTPVLLAPAAAQPAFELDTDRDVFALFEHCKLASALGLPAAVVPVGNTVDGLPVGVQVIGRRDREDEVLGVARAIEREMTQSCE